MNPLAIVKSNAEQLKLDEKEQYYSQLINQIRSQRNALSPIFRSPPEVLVAIFKSYREKSYRPTYSHPAGKQFDPHHCRITAKGSRHDALITLTYVCKAWRFLVLDTPMLWDHIDLSHPLALSKTLELSKGIPICIVASNIFKLPNSRYFSLSGPEWTGSHLLNSLRQALVHCSQVRSIDLKLPFEQMDAIVQGSLSQPSVYLSLSSLILHGALFPASTSHRWSDRPDIIECPVMESISLMGCPFPSWLRIESMLRLRVLEIDLNHYWTDPLADLINILSIIHSSITTLIVLYLPKIILDEDQSEPSFMVQNTPIHLPRLTSLVLFRCTATCTAPLLTMLDAPSARCSLYFCDVPEFIGFLKSKPLTPEWRSVLGNYSLSFPDAYNSVELSPRQKEIVDSPLDRSSRQLPFIFAEFTMTDFLRDIPGDMKDVWSYLHPVITHLCVNVDLLKAPPVSSNEPVEGNSVDQNANNAKWKERLLDLLACLPSVEELHLCGLTPKDTEDDYIAEVLQIANPSNEGGCVQAICPALQCLELKYNVDCRRPLDIGNISWLPKLNKCRNDSDVLPLRKIYISVCILNTSIPTLKWFSEAGVHMTKKLLELDEGEVLGNTKCTWGFYQ